MAYDPEYPIYALAAAGSAGILFLIAAGVGVATRRRSRSLPRARGTVREIRDLAPAASRAGALTGVRNAFRQYSVALGPEGSGDAVQVASFAVYDVGDEVELVVHDHPPVHRFLVDEAQPTWWWLVAAVTALACSLAFMSGPFA